MNDIIELEDNEGDVLVYFGDYSSKYIYVDQAPTIQPGKYITFDAKFSDLGTDRVFLFTLTDYKETKMVVVVDDRKRKGDIAIFFNEETNISDEYKLITGIYTYRDYGEFVEKNSITLLDEDKLKDFYKLGSAMIGQMCDYIIACITEKVEIKEIKEIKEDSDNYDSE